MHNFFRFLVVMAVLVSVITSCQKHDLEVRQLTGNAQPQAVVKPDVYVENGYLAFKDMEAVDSLIQMLGKMTTEQKENWENQMGLKSARAEFDALFDEYENLSSYEAFLAFKQRNKEKLKFNETDPDDCSIDYPYKTIHFLPVLNNKGLIKIGESLIKYTKEDHIVIKNGDIDALNDLTAQVESGNVFIYPKLKSTYIDDDLINDFPDNNPFGASNRWHEKTNSRRLNNELRIERYRTSYKDAYSNEFWVRGYYVYFKQRAQKKSWGSWNDYKTRYTFDEIKIKVGSEPIDEYDPYTPLVSAEVKPSASVQLFHYQSAPIYGLIPNLFNIPSISFSVKTSCSGFDMVLYPIDHVVHSGFTTTSGGIWTPTPSY